MNCPSMASSPAGIRLYEDDGGLLASIVIANDVANLHRYFEDFGPPVFGEPAECEDDYFFMATVNGSTDTLRVLAEIYQSDLRQKEPLRSRLERQNIRLLNLACANAQFKTAEYLMNCGPPLGEMFHERGYADAPLTAALAALNLVKEAPARRNAPAASQETIEEFVCSLLDRGASVRATNDQLPSTQRPTVLGSAAALGSYNLASRLIADGADLHGKETWHEIATGSIDNVTALHIASGSWNLSFVQALLESYGVDEFAQAASTSDSRGRLPLHWALLNLDNTFNKPSDEQTISTGLKIVNLLLESNSDTINVQSSHGAAFNFLTNGYVMGAGSLAIMKVLLRFNPKISTVNAQDQSGATALLTVLSYHETCNVVRGSYTMPLVELLLAHGADTTAYDKKGQTALHKLAASPSYHDPISPNLLEKFIPSVNINKADVNGWTALHWMAKNLRQVEASRLLVRRGADVNAVNKKGNTPLHEAMGGRLIRKEKADGTLDYPTLAEKIRAFDEIVSILREAGASMDQPNFAGQTPAQLQEQKRARWEKGGE